MTVDEILNQNPQVTFKLYATLNGEHWFQLGKELKSKALVLGALKKTVYPPKFSEYRNLMWVKSTKTVDTKVELFSE